MTSCKQCGGQFEIQDVDREFYRKMDVPEPTLCSFCRYQRRLAHRNERTLYRRKCDATGKDVVAIYPADSHYTVYEQSYWRSDAWDAREFGRDFDFSRPFFEQMQDLRLVVPRLSLNSPESGTANTPIKASGTRIAICSCRAETTIMYFTQCGRITERT